MIGVSQKKMSAMEVAFLGQMGFRIESKGVVLYVDPFLCSHPKRMIPSPMDIEAVCDADFILGTHDHKDHIDRAAWSQYAKASPRARFVVPELLLRGGLAADLGISADRFSGLTHLQDFLAEEIEITAVASAHEFLDKDAGSGLYPYLGYVIRFPEYTIYHAGDTCRYEGLESTLKKWEFDMVVLPINGRDAERYSCGCVGNMTYQEAADLAGALSPQIVIPGHWDLFAHNSEDPELFRRYCSVKYPELRVEVLQAGEYFNFKK